MVKALYLGLLLLAALVVCVAVPISPPGSGGARGGTLLADDGSVRSERSTNLSHITGSLRKIQMYVKNWHLQIAPDGVVNGTQEDNSDYTILQRTTVNIGQVKIQGVSTCQYLCMDSCGLLYGTKDFNDECVFNEMIEQHNYNTYSSSRYSNARRTMYVALNRRGQPRRVQVQAQKQLGKLSTYARVLTKWVSVEKVEALLQRLGASGGHPLRHHGSGGHVCPQGPPVTTPPPDPASGDRLRCRKRKKRKKKRRRCGPGVNPTPDNPCMKKKPPKKKPITAKRRKLCEKDNTRKICQRLVKSDKVKKNNKQNKNKKTLRGGKKSVKTVFNATTTTATFPETTEMLSTSYEDFSTTESSSLSQSLEESSSLVDSSMSSSDDDLLATDTASMASAGVETD